MIWLVPNNNTKQLWIAAKIKMAAILGNTRPVLECIKGARGEIASVCAAHIALIDNKMLILAQSIRW